MRILTPKVPLKQPYWKLQAFGIPKQQFIDYDIVQTRCSFRNCEGELEYPHLYQIASTKALNSGYLIMGDKELVIIPIKDWEIVNEDREDK